MSIPYFSTVLIPIPGTSSNSSLVPGRLVARALSVRSLKIRNAGTPRRRASTRRHTRSAASRRESDAPSTPCASCIGLGPATVSARCPLSPRRNSGFGFPFAPRGRAPRVLHDELHRRSFVEGVAGAREPGLTGSACHPSQRWRPRVAGVPHSRRIVGDSETIVRSMHQPAG